METTLNTRRISRLCVALLVAVALVAALPSAGFAGGSLASSGTTGTVRATTQPAQSCPAGHTCQVISVSCPNLSVARNATIAIGAPTGAIRGVVVLLTGGSGTRFWAETAATISGVAKLRAGGLEVVQARWHQSWLAAGQGELAGSAALACRPASLIRWIHDTRFVPIKLPPANDGRCGFCVSGVSGGSSATAYSLSHYGLDTIIDGAFPVAGPPHVAVDKGCAARAGEEGYWYQGSNTKTIDSSYGYTTTGPCTSHDPSFAPNWQADGIESSGTDYTHPTTRIHFLVGSLDQVMAKHLGDYTPVLQANGTAFTVETLPNVGHDISKSAFAVDRVVAALLA